MPLAGYQAYGAKFLPPASLPRAVARKGARELGLVLGEMPPAKGNAITDVSGVRVGHAMVWKGEGKLVPGKGPARTGVTAILPGEGNWLQEKVVAGMATLNGCGEMTGSHMVEEFGLIETPIMLTTTNSVGNVAACTLRWLLDRGYADGTSSETVIPTVAECDDSFLNDAWGFHVRREDVFQALDDASPAFAQGSVGGGTGMSCLGFKGGIGSSSRRVALPSGEYTVGVLVQANFGVQERLTVKGVPVGQLLRTKGIVGEAPGGGSIISVVATDAPLTSRQLDRLARRTFLGLARVGSISHNGSGDISMAFTTANRVDNSDEGAILTERRLNDRGMSPLFQATVEATEEAVVNALFHAETVVGRDDNTSHALPVDRVMELFP